MPDRDAELGELQRELDAKIRDLEGQGSNEPSPFIERPDSLDIEDGALCWMDGTRVCGADCVGYNVEMSDPETGEMLQGPNKCLPLLYMGQQGAASLSTLLVNRKRVTQIQDEQRAAQAAAAPPSPFGT